MAKNQDWTGKQPPEIQEGIWVNSKPLTLGTLRGKVVLADFWEYSCINCIRTLPYLTEWYKRYKDLGLEIIGIHAPEFEFGKKKENVEQAMKKLGVVWPVIMDNDFKTWRAYENSVWPRELLIDQGGIVVHDQAGEGGYQETEKNIQELLKKDNPDHKFPELMQPVRETDEPHKVCYRTSPELYAGTDRGELGNKGGYKTGDTAEYSAPSDELEEDLIYLSGSWQALPQFLRPSGADSQENLWLGLKYHAKGVYAVIKPEAESNFKVYVEQDGKPISKESAGEDIKWDGDKTYLEVAEARMYRIVDNPVFGVHKLHLIPKSDSFGFYTFTFESACEV